MNEATETAFPDLSFYMKRYWTALKNALKPKFLLKAAWRTISRRLFIALFVAPFIYGLAAIWHIYSQAKAGGWSGDPGRFIQPDSYALAGARWFSIAMLIFGIYGFVRGIGFKLFRTTWSALRVAPSGFRYSLESVKLHFKEPAFYERVLIVAGGASLTADITLRICGWQFRKFVLLAAAVAVVAGLKAAHGQWSRERYARPPVAYQFWVFLLAVSIGFFLTYLYYSFLGMVALGGGIFLWYRRTHPPEDNNGNGDGRGRGSSVSSLLILVLFLFLNFAPGLLFADDGGWGEYTPKNGEEKTLLGYLQTPEGQKMIRLGLIAGGFATVGGVLGFLVGGTLGDAVGQSLGEMPPVPESDDPTLGDISQDEQDDEIPVDEPGWQVTDADGKIHNFESLDDAQEFCDKLSRGENARQAENDFHNTVEQIGFVESVRNGLRKAGRDTSSQDRELERLRREKNRHAKRVNELGGSTDYEARNRSDWDFTESDEFIRKQKENKELLRDIHKTSKATRNLADQDNIDYGEGQTNNILKRLKKLSDRMVSRDGEPPTREELNNLQKALRNEIDAARIRKDARNTNWVKEGTQSTSREIFSGVNQDGETSYKSMAFRGLLGVASGGQSEYVLEVGEKMYIVHDEVMKGKSGMEAFKTAATRVVFDEATGRIVEVGIKTGGKAGSAGYSKFVKGTSIDDALTSSVGNTKKFLNQDVGEMVGGAGKESVPAYKPKALKVDEDLIKQRTDAFNQGREVGTRKVADLDDAVAKYNKNPNSPKAAKELREAVDRVQKDKHAMNVLNDRGDDVLGNKVREGFNRDLKTSYEQAHLTSRERIAQEYGVPLEDVKVVKPTNDPGLSGNIEAADPRGFARKPDPDFKTHSDDFTQTKPTGEIEGISGEKVSFDQDVTYRVKQDNIIDPRTGKVETGYADVPSADAKRIYEEEFYKARNNGELPYKTDTNGKIELDPNGRPVIDSDQVHQYNKDMDQAVNDRLDPGAYGTGDRDLQTATKGDYKSRDFSDVEGVGKASEYKQHEWRNEASDLNERASGLRQKADEFRSSGDTVKADQALDQAKSFEAKAEGLTEEGYRQTTKQYGNQLEARVDATNQQEFYKHQNNGELPMKKNELSGEMEVDMNQVRSSQEDFYKSQKGELPTIKNSDGSVKLDTNGNPQIDTKEVTRFTTEQGRLSGMRTAEISPKLTEAVDIMKKTGQPGFSPAEVDMELAKIGYTPEKVAEQLSGNLESLQKFKASDISPRPSIPVKSADFDFEGAWQRLRATISKPIAKDINRGFSD